MNLLHNLQGINNVLFPADTRNQQHVFSAQCGRLDRKRKLNRIPRLKRAESQCFPPGGIHIRQRNDRIRHGIRAVQRRIQMRYRCVSAIGFTAEKIVRMDNKRNPTAFYNHLVQNNSGIYPCIVNHHIHLIFNQRFSELRNSSFLYFGKRIVQFRKHHTLDCRIDIIVVFVRFFIGKQNNPVSAVYPKIRKRTDHIFNTAVEHSEIKNANGFHRFFLRRKQIQFGKLFRTLEIGNMVVVHILRKSKDNILCFTIPKRIFYQLLFLLWRGFVKEPVTNIKKYLGKYTVQSRFAHFFGLLRNRPRFQITVNICVFRSRFQLRLVHTVYRGHPVPKRIVVNFVGNGAVRFCMKLQQKADHNIFGHIDILIGKMLDGLQTKRTLINFIPNGKNNIFLCRQQTAERNRNHFMRNRLHRLLPRTLNCFVFFF